ncbi:MAG: hypothetical protein ETSY2_00095 [Candidatus Entotheonella gemina]|uniref:Uncharacterized protein n=1 Tax=Candidatus Entotheonella gemina TaxID=1429439 RepID=W4MGQ7_9BACT|nr:MAG: hypothetical protein ETSY2_00095 [Candidatus Entotheonella gemina]
MIPSDPASRPKSGFTHAQLALGMAGPYAHWWITAVVMLGFTTAGILPALWMRARRQAEPAQAAVDSPPEPPESKSSATLSPTVAHVNGTSQPAAMMAAVSTHAATHRTAS